MASNIPTEVIAKHNALVLHLRKHIVGPDLQDLKQLFSGNPLTPLDIESINNIYDLFHCLTREKKIDVGNYDQLVQKLQQTNPNLVGYVQEKEREIKNLLDGGPSHVNPPTNAPAQQQSTGDEIVVTMEEEVCRVKEGDVAFLDCFVDPEPKRVIWKKGDERRINTRIPMMNSRYYCTGPQKPTLIIRSVKKMDEAYYQCTAKDVDTANGKEIEVKGDAVSLEVVSGAVGSDGDRDGRLCSLSRDRSFRSRSPEDRREENQRTEVSGAVGSDGDRDGRLCSLNRDRSFRSRSPEDRREENQRTEALYIWKSHCDMYFVITNHDDMDRVYSFIQEEFIAATGQNRIQTIGVERKCIQVILRIKGADNLSEAPAVCLAEEFKNYILDVGLQLSEESNDILKVDESSIKITPGHMPDNVFFSGHPLVNISHPEFSVNDSESVSLQTYVISSPRALSIDWFRINAEGNEMAITIDSKKYYGGSYLSPSLIIRNVDVDDQGWYMCRATNNKGTGCSQETFVRIMNESTPPKEKPKTEDVLPKTQELQTLQPSQTSGKRPASVVCTESSAMASNIPPEAIAKHNELVYHLKERIVDAKLQDLKGLFRDNPLTPRDMASINDFYGLIKCLIDQEKIAVGNYEQLREKLQMTNKYLVGYVKNKESEIKVILDGGRSPAKPPRMPDPDQQQSTEIHPDLKPMIGTTKAMIKKEKERKFYTTKGFSDAKSKLQQKRVVVMKGNTGDGKTAIAIQLIHWLQEQQAGQPLKINNIKKLDLLEPHLKLITFIDDIFGEKDVCQKDVSEWNKRISYVKTLFVDEEANNFLVITIRNEVHNSLEAGSRGTILTDDHIIDLSSKKYKIEKEKKGLLELYKPQNFSWSDKEKDQIVTCAPNIGFPQCCHLFYNSVELQKERVKFFENPFDFLNEALSKLQERSALLYLFFNDGKIRVKDLDPKGQNVNKELLEEAFDIKLFRGKYDSSKLTYKEKVSFVKESLEKLLGFLVMTGKYRSHEDVYRFHHDSIYVAVALLYGKATPFGYIQNCPSKCLSYLTTSETATNMIVISSDHYTEMCERVLREFVCKEWYGASVGSLDVWKDPVFVQRFVGLLNERKVDKLAVLNKACLYGAEECALYLLCEERVKPDKDTALSLVSRHWNDGNKQLCLLKEIVVYLNDKTKLAVLNKACESGAEECVLYLLCEERVKPDKDTVFYVVEGGSIEMLRKLLEYDVTSTARRGYTDGNVLHEACLWGREEMVTLLYNTYPHLVLDTDRYGQTPLHYVAWRGSVGLFQTVERFVLNSLYRVENQQTKCESVDGCVVHKYCVCAQYMSQFVDGYGGTVLHHSCDGKVNREVFLYLCRSYPGLIPMVNTYGRHCLHYIAGNTSDVDVFTECETYGKQYVESTGGQYDVTTILDNDGKSVLDLAKVRRSKNNPLLEHLVKVFDK